MSICYSSFYQTINYKDMAIFQPIGEVDFSGHTLIIPSVSVGNVGQLCADLLISSIPCTHSGYLWHDALIPLVGNHPFSDQTFKLALGAEVYHNQQKKVVIVQIRSALVRELKEDFFKQLISWITESNVSQVVILTGSVQHERNDSQINSLPFRYVACPKTIAKHGIFKNAKWIPLENRQFHTSAKADDPDKESCVFTIPGGGYAKHLYEGIVEANVPCAVILKFTGEGDNIPDAVFLAEHLVSWIPLVSFRPGSTNSIQCVYPLSWRLLFGNGPPDGLY